MKFYVHIVVDPLIKINGKKLTVDSLGDALEKTRKFCDENGIAFLPENVGAEVYRGTVLKAIITPRGDAFLPDETSYIGARIPLYTPLETL